MFVGLSGISVLSQPWQLCFRPPLKNNLFFLLDETFEGVVLLGSSRKSELTSSVVGVNLGQFL